MKMDMFKQWRHVDIRYYAVAASLLLSLWHAVINSIPNVDAFSYIRTAEIFLIDGLSAAFQHYPSATYPVMMALLHRITGLDLFTAGQIMNAVLYAMLVYTFISLTQEVRDSRRLALIAAITILVFPQINEYRFYLIRDIGFVSFMLIGLLQLTRYCRSARPQTAVYFGIAILAAAVFRAEALVYLLGVPALLCLFPGSPRKLLLKLLVFLASFLAGGVLLAALMNIDITGTIQRIIAVYVPFLRDAALTLGAEDSALGSAIFGEYAANFSGQYLWLFMLTGLSSILIMKLIVGFGIPAIMILLYGAQQRMLQWRDPMLRPALAAAVIAFVIMLTFLALTRFLSTRYTLLFCVLVLLLIPLFIDKVLDAPKDRIAMQKMGAVLGLLLLYCSIDAHISFGVSKVPVQQASEWLRNNTPADASVLTNSNYLAYHSERVAAYDKIERYINNDTIRNTAPGTFLALNLVRGTEMLSNSIVQAEIELVIAFPDAQNPTFVIYRRTGN
jgi:hypothetical protein